MGIMEHPKVQAFLAWLAEFVTENRAYFVIVFVLPLSIVFDAVMVAREWAVMKFYSAPHLHSKRLAHIGAQLQAWRDAGSGSKLCTARGGWQSISPSMRQYKSVATPIAIDLYDILEIKEAGGETTVRVEPCVTMGQLSKALIPKGLSIPILPELDDLTVGGLYMGVGIETTSHKYGLFNDTVVAAEIITAEGKVVQCSATENRDLFDALPWSYGTLGFLTAVTIKCIKVNPYVRLEYIPTSSQAEAVALITKYSDSSAPNAPDFVECLAYTVDRMVVMPGWFASTNEAETSGAINVISRWYKPWFYKHVESVLVGGKTTTEFIPLRDYYHRHTRSIFWEMELIIPFGNHPLFRMLLGWAVPPKVSFLKLTQTSAIRDKYEREHVIQDMMVPLADMGKALNAFEEHYGIYPLWVCPYRAYDYSTEKASPGHRCFLRKPNATVSSKEAPWKHEMYVDLGAYGVPRTVLQKKPFDVVANGRAVESTVAAMRGFQMLYADSYLDKAEFRSMFSHDHYDVMKAKYDPKGAFPEVYAKVCKKAASYWAEEKARLKK